MDVRDEIKRALSAALVKLGIPKPHEFSLEHPAELKNGDYATNVALKMSGPLHHGNFSTPPEKNASWTVGRQESEPFNKNPRALAEKIVVELATITGVSKIEIAGPGFINFHLSSETLATSIKTAIETDMWGANKINNDKKIMVEYTDPNPFKEFHIGHLMSNAIGESIARLLQFSGAEVKRANYQGDVGPHVAKAIWGKMQKPELSWGEAYAYGSQQYETNKEAVDAINAKVYARDDETINALYDNGRKESLEHFKELYKILGTKFDFYFFESATAPKGVELVRAHPEVFEQSDGAIVYKGEQDGLHTRVFITSKGLPTYEAKDLGLAELKSETWPFDISITVTAHEQADYFAVVLAAMRKVFPQIASKIKHVSHGMMRLPTGKMSSRTGDVITGESLLADLTEAAKERAAESRADDKAKLAQDVAVAAIKYQILKQASGKDIIFDKERALSLEGDSGPYLQYAHARTHQIVEKAREQNVVAKFDDADQSELARMLHRFPEIVEYAAKELEPHLLTTYLLNLASAFNSWYAQEQILDGTSAVAHKVALTDAVRRTLKNGLWILGIPAPERM